MSTRDLPQNILAGVRKLVDGLQRVESELTLLKKCELTILSHTTEKEIQTSRRLKAWLPELKLVPAADFPLPRAPLSEKGISEAIRRSARIRTVSL